jgi:MFS family permease
VASNEAWGVLDLRTDELSGIAFEPPPSGAGDQRLLRLILYDALASEAMGTLTTGVFLVGFAVALGAGNFAIGVLAAVPFCVQLLQIPAVLLVERLRARRAVSVASTAFGRSFLLAAALAPLFGPSFSVVALIVSLAIYQAMAAIAGCAWNSWMRDLVPSSQYGRFFGRRTMATTALSITLALLGGMLVDTWKKYVPAHDVFGYSILFAIAAIVGFVGVYLLHITPDPPMAPTGKIENPFTVLLVPLRETNFRRLIIFLSSWNFAANLAAPFFTVYMLKSLGYSMTTVLALTIGSQLANLVALGLWGPLSDRFSNKAVLEIAAPLFLFCTFAWTFTGSILGPAHDALPAYRHPRADGRRDGWRRTGVRQYRHETVAGGTGNSVSCGQQRHLGVLRRGGADPRRFVRRLLRRTPAHARFHVDWCREGCDGPGAQFPIVDFLFRNYVRSRPLFAASPFIR